MGAQGLADHAGEPTIVGREIELAAIGQVLSSGGGQHCLAFVGEPGIGKTLLLGEMCARADAFGFQVLAGRGTEFEQEAPFAAVIDAVDTSLSQLAADAHPLAPDHLEELIAILPSLSTPQERPRPRIQIERYRLYAAIRAALEELASDHPVLLALEDLHWADRASIELICHLLRRPFDTRVVLALAYQPDDASAMLLECVARCVRDGTALELLLGPLTRADADALLCGSVSPADREAVYRESGGNPFYLTELARAAARSDLRDRRATDTRSPPGMVPESVRTAIAAELGRLRTCGAQLARAGAVVGEPFEFDLARQVATMTEADALVGLDELLHRGLLRPADAPRHYRFRHPIVRRAVYSAAGAGFRTEAHRRAAAVLAARGAPIAVQARHIERSAQTGDYRAAELLKSAADSVTSSAPATAAQWYDRALGLLGDAAPPVQQLSLLVPLAEALGASGQSAASRRALERALALVPAGEPATRARIATAAAWLDHSLGRHGEVRAGLRQALGRLADRPSTARAELKLELALDYLLATDYDGLPAAAADALAEAESIGDPLMISAALSLSALATVHTGSLPGSIALVDRAAGMVSGLSDEQLAERITTLTSLGAAECALERLTAAGEHFERALRIIRATAQNAPFPLVTLMLGVVRHYQGRLAEAAVSLGEVLEAALLLGEPALMIAGHSTRSLVASQQGDLSTAIAEAETAVTLADSNPPSHFSWRTHVCLAIALLETNEPVRAQREILDHAGGDHLTAVEASLRPRIFATLVRIAIATDQLEAADRWVLAAERGANDVGLSGRIADACQARAELGLARGEPRLALRAASAAVERYRSVGYGVEVARSRRLIGMARLELGEREQGLHELRRAHDAFGSCGAHGWQRATAGQLRELGVRPTDPVGATLSELSTREREIAELVSHGMTNREIASRLVLSNRTVESHLWRIFRKLSMRSRAELAFAIERDRTARGETHTDSLREWPHLQV